MRRNKHPKSNNNNSNNLLKFSNSGSNTEIAQPQLCHISLSLLWLFLSLVCVTFCRGHTTTRGANTPHHNIYTTLHHLASYHTNSTQLNSTELTPNSTLRGRNRPQLTTSFQHWSRLWGSGAPRSMMPPAPLCLCYTTPLLYSAPFHTCRLVELFSIYEKKNVVLRFLRYFLNLKYLWSNIVICFCK